MKKLVTSIFSLFLLFNITAQETKTVEELQAMYDAKATEAAALQAEANAIKAKIDAIPGGWEIGGLGIVGFDMSDNTAWYALGQPYSSQNSLGLGFAAFANLDEDKMFWNNGLTINMKRQNSKRFDTDETTESITDALIVNSLAGYKLSKKIALSAEANFNSSFLEFANPGQLTMSAGATWLPIKNLKVIVHPLGYQINFPTKDFTSAPGAKIGATYNKELFKGVSWNSSLTSFLAYSGGENLFFPEEEDYTASQLSNWTWLNGFGFNLWKGIGVGLNFGLRGDRQLVDKYRSPMSYDEALDDKSNSENPLQFYYNLGLSYGF